MEQTGMLLRKAVSKILMLLLISGVASAASKVQTVTTLPATCVSGDGVFPADTIALVSGGTTVFYICSASNTWTAPGASASAGGTNGQIEYNNNGPLGGFADGTSHQVLHGGKTFSQVDLTADVTGVLPSANLPTTTVYTGQINTFGLFAQTFRSGADFVLSDPTTSTKTAIFDLSNIGSSTQRTVNIPNANSTTVQANTGTTHNFATAISAQGVVSLAQPAFTDLSGTASAAQLPNPSASTLGGIESIASASHKWINSISTSGVPSLTQPDLSDLSGATTLVTSAASLTNNQLVFGAGSQGTAVGDLTGDVTTAGAKATTLGANFKRRAISFTFGSPEGSALTTNLVRYVTVPFACTLSGWNILVDAGTTTIKTWKIATGTAIPTVSNVLSTSGVAISTGTAIHSTTMTDFSSTAVSQNDILAVTDTAVSTAKMINITFECDQ